MNAHKQQESDWYNTHTYLPPEREPAVLALDGGQRIDGYYSNGVWRDEHSVEIDKCVLGFRCEREPRIVVATRNGNVRRG